MAEAIVEYQQVIRLSPRDVAANVELARLQLRTGQPQAAVGFAEQALRGQPETAPPAPCWRRRSSPMDS